MQTKQYPNLLRPLQVGRTTFRNRLFFSAHNHPFCRTGGVITDEGIAYYQARAKGGCAQVSLGETPVDSVHAYKGTLDEHLLINVPLTVDFRVRMTKLSTVVHAHGCKLAIQLMHAGENAANPIGPCGFVRPDGVKVREMDEELMAMTVKNFADSADMAQRLGFDTVQIHGGHGWLLSQFTSPLFNHRTDEYGGSLENRLRFPIRVLKAVREAISPDMLIEYRISGDEFTPRGYNNADACEICKALEPYVDLFQISAGVYTDGVGTRMFPTLYHPHCVNVELAANIKRHVSKPVITVGAIMTPDEAETILAEGKADVVAMARTLIAEPEFIKKVSSGKSDEIIPCVRCFNCMGGNQDGPAVALRCTVNPVSGMEEWLRGYPAAPAETLRVVVIGGGPGGMMAAITAAKRGHNVTLMEKKDALGGTLWFADLDEHKADLRRMKDYLIRMANRYVSNIHLSVEATPELVAQENPDVVIVAVGATPVVPPIPGIEKSVSALDVYAWPKEELGDRVVFIGGGLVGCETAYSLATEGKQVTIVEMMGKLASEAGYTPNIRELTKRLKELDVEICLNSRCSAVTNQGVLITAGDGSQRMIPADTVVCSAGMRPNKEIAAQFHGCAPRVIDLGDCVKSGKILQPIHDGYFAVCDL